MRIQTLLFFLSFALAAAFPWSCPSAEKLNLLLITADDMNADSLGWMGSKAGATPTLDALAAKSHRFVNHHVTAPICQPSREAFMTGLVPHRSGALGFHPIKAGTPTLVTLLKAESYYTAAVNKIAHMRPAAEFPWDGMFEGSGKNAALVREHTETSLQDAAKVAKPFFINVNITYPHRPFPGGSGGDDDGIPVTEKKKAKVAQKLKAGTEAVEAKLFRPEEIEVPAFLEDIPPVRAEVAQYFTAVARFDYCLKGVLEELKESGLEDKTLVVFLSDHGMSFPFSKATVYRNGTRSPVVLRWPGMPAAAMHEEWVSSVDLLPTLLEILGVAAPSKLDGRSWGPLLKGETQSDRDYVITHVNTVSSGMSLPQRCIRTADFALMFHAWTDGSAKFKVEAMSGITYQALETAGKGDERIAARVQQLRIGETLSFFDLREDPSERKNLIHDAGRQAEVLRLGNLLLAHMEKTDDPQAAAFRAAFDHWKAETSPK